MIDMEWIPITERMPTDEEYSKDNGWFQTTHLVGERSFVTDLHLCCYCKDLECKRWVWDMDDCKLGNFYDVVAWMPLPEPYNDKKVH